MAASPVQQSDWRSMLPNPDYLTLLSLRLLRIFAFARLPDSVETDTFDHRFLQAGPVRPRTAFRPRQSRNLICSPKPGQDNVGTQSFLQLRPYQQHQRQTDAATATGRLSQSRAELSSLPSRRSVRQLPSPTYVAMASRISSLTSQNSKVENALLYSRFDRTRSGGLLRRELLQWYALPVCRVRSWSTMVLLRCFHHRHQHADGLIVRRHLSPASRVRTARASDHRWTPG